MMKKRSFWISLCLFNLCLVALFGFGLRSKILFTLPRIDYRNLLSAHSHFAFAGWAGLSLITLLIYDLLPAAAAQKKIYLFVLAGLEISSLGMACTFPFYGYNAASITFSTLYIAVVMLFVPFFIKDVLRTVQNSTVKLLSITALASLVLSFLGTLGLVYILLSQSANALLYRDSIYTFLHFQYNGFFTVSIFALLFNKAIQHGFVLEKNAQRFALFLCLSIAPSLFLSLLWHNNILFYLLAGIGCMFMIISLIYFFRFTRTLQQLFKNPMVIKIMLQLSLFSFALKMILNIGTVFPQLGNAVYGDRPVIIGFLHLVFLGFVTFYLLATLLQNNYFTTQNKTITYPFYVFAFGIIANEFLLMVQGLGILFKTNHEIFKWLLWSASIFLFAGALLIMGARFVVVAKQKNKAMA